MKKFTHRLLPLALCFTLTLGVFAYRPPQAEAVVGVDDAVVIGALLSAFAGGCGLIFSNNGMSSSELAQGLTDKWNEFNEAAESGASSFAAWLGFEDTSALLGALSFSGGKLAIPRAIAQKFAEFTTWLVENLGVTAGGDGVSVVSSDMQGLTGRASGYTVRTDDYWSNYYTTSFSDNSLEIVAKSSNSTLGYGTLTFRTPTFVAPETGRFAISFSGSTSATLKDASTRYGYGFGIVYVYKSNSPDSESFSYAGRLLDNEVYNGGAYCANSGPCAASQTYSFIEGEKYYFEIKIGAEDALLSALFLWDFKLQRSASVIDLSVSTPAGVQTPDLADDEGTNPTITGVGWDAATIEDLLQKILEQLQTNTLAPALNVAGTETGGDTGTDEDSKPYLPYIPQIFEKIKDLPGTLSNIWESIKGIPAAIAEKLGAFFTTLWGWLQSIIDAITALPAAIAEKVGELFKPDEALVTEIVDAFKGKFGFLSTLNSFVNDLFSLTPESDPPVIWVHLENAESKYGYSYGDKQKILDLSWYQKYKASVDGILSGFLWLGYLWLLFKRAPAILGGMQLSADDAPRSVDMPDVLSSPRLGAGDGSTMYRGDGFTMRDKGGRSK